MEIKFCENNFSHGTEEIMERLQNELEDATVEAEPCLGYCGDCANGPFAIVDDEYVGAETPDELYRKILEIGA